MFSLVLKNTNFFIKGAANKTIIIVNFDLCLIAVPKLPTPIAKLTAKFFQLFPNPLLTEDQLRLLKYDNISSGKYKTNSDIGIPSVRYFDEEVKKYCYMWRDGGQFSTEKYFVHENSKRNKLNRGKFQKTFR